MLIEPNLPTRHWLRTAYYRLVPASLAHWIHRGRSEDRAHEKAEYWNEELSGRMSSPNRNGRMSNALRDNTAAVLIEECGPPPRRVLDLGCGFGDLAHVLAPRGMEVYHGVDLSDYVIERARRESATWPFAGRSEIRFTNGDLRSFQPPPGAEYDVLVFNEVLKYVEIGEAVDQLRRLSRVLAPDGVICVNISGDPKSRAIFRTLAAHFEWIYGTVYQQRPRRPIYRLTRNAATPPFLVGIFRPVPLPAGAGS